uniref:Major facilitator superfamily (MFS) profile domain-containing protein n=1 Tax=Leersia perrieri TaxID=77586 RepID=A0A0D9WPJ4_9ORYZ
MEDVESVGSSSPCNLAINRESIVHTEDQTLHIQRSPEPKLFSRGKTLHIQRSPKPSFSSRGKMTMALLLVSYALVNFAFFGVAVDLVVFHRQVLHQENAEAANKVSEWMGTVYIFSLFGAFLSDSYMGRYLTCVVFQIILVVGLVLLSLSSWLLLVVPLACGDGGGLRQCTAPSERGVAMFYLSIYMVAFGNGGYQPSLATFGADQFDDDADPGEQLSKRAFFCLFYLSLNVGSLFSNSVLAFFEDRGNWVPCFLVSSAAAGIALVLFLLGTPHYRQIQPSGNPLTRVMQVFVAAYCKRHIRPPPGDHLHEVEGEISMIRGVGKIRHSDQLRFLDRAATATEEDYHAGNGKNPWRLCTVTQVEEAKCLLGMMPIWVCTIIYSMEYTQMSSMFVEQGAAMDTNILGGMFKVPAAAMSVFDVVGVVATLALYHYVVVPVTAILTNNPRGISELKRMGMGLVIALLGMVAAAVVEVHRLRDASNHGAMTVLWQAPQYTLIGVSEVFMYVGQLEFFNAQSPDGVKSLGSSLCMASISLGNYASMVIVSTINGVTSGRRSGRAATGWIPADLNRGHLDRFFITLAALSAVDFVVFMVFARLFKGIKLEENGHSTATHIYVV